MFRLFVRPPGCIGCELHLISRLQEADVEMLGNIRIDAEKPNVKAGLKFARYLDKTSFLRPCHKRIVTRPVVLVEVFRNRYKPKLSSNKTW